MNIDVEQAPDGRVQRVGFPWPSALAGLLAIGYLIVTSEAAMVAHYPLPEHWLTGEAKLFALAVFILLLLVDLRRYRRQDLRRDGDLRRLRQELDDLWQHRKDLQHKAYTYSGHADKLKMFISDKLLEYIEYDEKFLHFRSIAAEVRHNGVISFDKVQAALQHAAEYAASDDRREYDAALDAMRYLWDLLDLSTADNLALHIGNRVCESEEHYYQRILNADEAAPATIDSVYPPQRAAWRALGHVRTDPLPPPAVHGELTLEDSQFHVRLAPAGELLGNENHLVLLLENLLRNAQFFSRKRGFAGPFPSVAVTLEEDQGHACLRVYNRGPHIRDEDRPNLFQLGFSTRRTREHQGRGVGLYFVNEIVKGYEGRIEVRNIHTPAARYAVRLALESGEVLTDFVRVVAGNGPPRIRLDDGTASSSLEWTLPAPLHSVEVTADGSHDTEVLESFDHRGRQTRFDPAHPDRPHWRLEYRPKRGDHRISFEPLDIGGVEFEVRLPTAHHRLATTELTVDADIDAEVERLNARFRAANDR